MFLPRQIVAFPMGRLICKTHNWPFPPNRPVPTTGPIPTTRPISSLIPSNGSIFPTIKPMYDERVAAKHHNRINRLILCERLLNDHGTQLPQTFTGIAIMHLRKVNFIWCNMMSEKSARLWDGVRFFGPFVGSAQMWESA